MICTYITKEQAENFKSVQDSSLNNLLQEARKIDSRIFLQEREVEIKKVFKKSKKVMKYTLMFHCGGIEYQLVNFDLGTEYSINTSVSKSHISAYLYGFLTRNEQEKSDEKKKTNDRRNLLFESIINHIEDNNRRRIPIERQFNEDGVQVTNEEYGVALLDTICEDLRGMSRKEKINGKWLRASTKDLVLMIKGLELVMENGENGKGYNELQDDVRKLIKKLRAKIII